jgi:hypothetical protein
MKESRGLPPTGTRRTGKMSSIWTISVKRDVLSRWRGPTVRHPAIDRLGTLAEEGARLAEPGDL